MIQRAIVRSPGPNFANGLTTVDLGPPDYDLALHQHEAYCSALLSCGLELIRLEPDERYPDSTFVEDTAVLTNRFAVLANPGAPARRGEVAGVAGVLTEFFSECHSVSSPGTLDGGDICEAGSHFFIGISRRTNETGARQLAEYLDIFGYTSSLIDIRRLTDILHLKSGIAYLGDNRLVTINALAELNSFRDYELVRINPGDEYAANCVRVNDRVLIAKGYAAFEERLNKVGYDTIALEMSEFQKMDGGLSCLSLRF